MSSTSTTATPAAECGVASVVPGAATEGSADNNDKNNQQTDNNNDNNESWKVQRDACKQLGDTAFRSGDMSEAIQHYSAALSLDPEFAVALSNRSAAYLKTNQISKAFYDAQACVKLNTMGSKAISRLAAALQSLKRWKAALTEWENVLNENPNNSAARKGVTDCRDAIQKEEERQRQQKQNEQKMKEKEERAAEEAKAAAAADTNEKDPLDDFFNDVEEAAAEVAKEKDLVLLEQQEQQAKTTNAIKNQKRDLGTAQQQIARILQDNFKWKNLNPFHVLDLSHTATLEEISRRYKALSLLLHPDKNRNNIIQGGGGLEKVQDAYDEVLRAKAILEDENKLNHMQQLCEQGMKQGKMDWEQRQKETRTKAAAAGAANGEDDEKEAISLELCQTRAIQKIFAKIEYERREVEQRERNQAQRERQQEEDELEKERNERKFDKSWKQDERVEKRIGSWRNFNQQASKKTKKTGGS